MKYSVLLFIVCVLAACQKEELGESLYQNFRGKFVYVTHEESTYEINVLRSDNNAQITYSTHDKVSPQWLPDGIHLLYLSNNNDQLNIHVIDEHGQHDQSLANIGIQSSPSYPTIHVSPDGKFAAVDSQDSVVLFSISDTYSLEKIAVYSCLSRYKYLTWSPNSKLFSCACSGADTFRHLNIFNVESSEILDATKDLGHHVVRQTWSYNSAQIAFGAGLDIYLINSDGTGLKKIIETSNYAESQLSFSPFENRLVYQRADSLFDLVIYDIASQSSEVLLEDKAYISGPLLWIESGKYIFYMYGKEVWDIDAAGLFDLETKQSHKIIDGMVRGVDYTNVE